MWAERTKYYHLASIDVILLAKGSGGHREKGNAALLPSNAMKTRISRGGSLGLLAAILVALTGCGPSSPDAQREEEYLPRFEAAMAAQRYCDALEMAGQRVNYVDTGRLQEETARRLLDWVPRLEAAKVGCARERWPAREAELKAQIQQAQDQQALYQDLELLSLQVVAGSWRQDGKGFLCLIDVVARNGSAQAISTFTLSPDPRRDMHMTAKAGPLDPALVPGETRTLTVCLDRVDVESYLQGDNLPAMPLYATTVELPDGRKANLKDWRLQDEDHRFHEQVGVLEARLQTENPFR